MYNWKPTFWIKTWYLRIRNGSWSLIWIAGFGRGRSRAIMAPKVFTLASKLYHTVKWLFFAHLNALFEPFDHIVEAPEHITRSNFAHEYPEFAKARERSNRTLHRMFIFPTLMDAYFILDSGYIFWRHNFDYFNDPMPDIITHKMFPEMFLAYGDQVVWAVVGACVLVFPHCWLHPFLKEKYVMIVVKNDEPDAAKEDEYCLFVNGKGNGGMLLEFIWELLV